MNKKLKSLFSNIKQRTEILVEIIQIEIWRTFHGKEFHEKYKNSKLVNPDVIKIYRDDSFYEPKQPDHQWTEEEVEEIAKRLRS